MTITPGFRMTLCRALGNYLWRPASAVRGCLARGRLDDVRPEADLAGAEALDQALTVLLGLAGRVHRDDQMDVLGAVGHLSGADVAGLEIAAHPLDIGARSDVAGAGPLVEPEDAWWVEAGRAEADRRTVGDRAL